MKKRWMSAGIAALIAAAAQSEFAFHTPPNEWDGPRLFHSSIDYLGEEKFAQYVSFKHVSMPEESRLADLEPVHDDYIAKERIGAEGNSPYKYLSPNNAYWYTVEDIYTASGARKGRLLIFNERDDLIQFDLEYYSNYAKEFRWINEKLLYVRIWIGRRGAIDFIFDVEHEAFTHRELVHDGLQVYQDMRGQRERFQHN